MISAVGPPEPPEHSAPQLTVKHFERDSAQVVALSGELDLRGAAALEAALADASDTKHDRVLLDLSALEFIDSTGMAIVIRAHQDLTAAGGAFAVVCCAGAVRRTLTTTGLMTMLTVVETVDEGLAAVAG